MLGSHFLVTAKHCLPGNIKHDRKEEKCEDIRALTCTSYNKNLMTGSKRYSKFCFPMTLNVPQSKAKGNIEAEFSKKCLRGSRRISSGWCKVLSFLKPPHKYVYIFSCVVWSRKQCFCHSLELLENPVEVKGCTSQLRIRAN